MFHIRLLPSFLAKMTGKNSPDALLHGGAAPLSPVGLGRRPERRPPTARYRVFLPSFVVSVVGFLVVPATGASFHCGRSQTSGSSPNQIADSRP